MAFSKSDLKRAGVDVNGIGAKPRTKRDKVKKAHGEVRALTDQAQGRWAAFDFLCESRGIPLPVHEYIFAPWEGGAVNCLHKDGAGVYVCKRCGATRRRWRFDFCWPAQDMALEVQGGIFTGGRHVQGVALVDEYEKLNNAALEGWWVLYCTPQQITDGSIFPVIRKALGID